MSSLEIFGMIGLGISVGLSKLGFPMALIFAPLLATTYGGKQATGIVIFPVLIADLIMLKLYGKNIDKKVLIRILPITCIGILTAVLFGQNISDIVFKKTIGVTILFVSILSLLKCYKINFNRLSLLFGFLGGFASFIGNVSGPLMSIYLLNIELSKNKFYGTRTVFYFLVNIVKFILYAIALKSVTIPTMQLGVIAIPFVFVGVFLGKYIIGKMNEHIFEIFIIIASATSGLLLILK